MSLVEFAKRELDLIGMTESNTEYMNRAMRKHILHMISEFGKEGHSGFSAAYAADVINKLMRYEPLSPLTGEDDEWTDVSSYGSSPQFQNKRCSHVFKDGNHAYDINGKVFVGPDEVAYTNKESCVDITFPYTPKTEYVNVPARSNDE